MRKLSSYIAIIISLTLPGSIAPSTPAHKTTREASIDFWTDPRLQRLTLKMQPFIHDSMQQIAPTEIAQRRSDVAAIQKQINQLKATPLPEEFRKDDLLWFLATWAQLSSLEKTKQKLQEEIQHLGQPINFDLISSDPSLDYIIDYTDNVI